LESGGFEQEGKVSESFQRRVESIAARSGEQEFAVVNHVILTDRSWYDWHFSIAAGQRAVN
jgi:hypothetical protein